MTDRALMPDYLRLIALYGIVVVNVGHMAFSLELGAAAATSQGPIDKAVRLLVDGLAMMKTFGLFSFMFGVGLAFQIRAAERRGLRFGSLYRNRMFGLILLGVAHGCLFMPGDILAIYGVMGGLLYLWRGWTPKQLVRVGAGLLIFQALLVSAAISVAPGQPPEIAALERLVMTGGTWGDVIGYRSESYPFVFVLLIFIQGFGALGWFCLGLASVKAGLIDQPDHPIWSRARRWALGPSVALSLIAAAITQMEGQKAVGEIMMFLVAPFATLGYLGLIALIARPPGPLMARALQAGGASLSVYLGQSIILSTIFAPYGLGLWDGVGPATAVLIALIVTTALIGALILWRMRFAMGPFEWVLRRITNLGARS